MNTFVINLQSAKDRRAHMLSQLSLTRLQYDFVDAVDATTIDTSDPTLFAIASSTWESRGETPSPSILACCLSHLRAYRAVLDAGVETALILEDDTILPPNLDQIVTEAANDLDLPEALLLQISCPDPPCKLSRFRTVTTSTGHVLSYPMNLHEITGAGAYLVTAEACNRMLAKLVPIRTQADDWSYFQSSGILARIRCMAPPPVKIDHSFASAIHHGNYSWRDPIYHALDHVPLAPVKAFMGFRRKRLHRDDSLVQLVDSTSPYCTATNR